MGLYRLVTFSILVENRDCSVLFLVSCFCWGLLFVGFKGGGLVKMVLGYQSVVEIYSGCFDEADRERCSRRRRG